MNIKDFMVATKTDHQLQNAIPNIQSEKWTKASDLFSVRHEQSVTNNGFLVRDTQIIMPSKLRMEILKHAHKGHQGIVKTEQALRTKVNGGPRWKKMQRIMCNVVMRVSVWGKLTQQHQ